MQDVCHDLRADVQKDPLQLALPCLVVEVGYSQRLPQLRLLAEHYITRSRGAIRCVVAFDLSYSWKKRRRSQRARVLVARAPADGAGRCAIITTDDFRDARGMACNGAVTLRPADLLPLKCSNLAHAPVVTLSFQRLLSSLSSAERDAAQAAQAIRNSAIGHSGDKVRSHRAR